MAAPPIISGFRIVAPHFVAGGEALVGVCVRAAPIIAYMVGWNGRRVAEYCKTKGWRCERLPLRSNHERKP